MSETDDLPPDLHPPFPEDDLPPLTPLAIDDLPRRELPQAGSKGDGFRTRDAWLHTSAGQEWYEQYKQLSRDELESRWDVHLRELHARADAGLLAAGEALLDIAFFELY
jgi:hypothetical protein